MRNRDETAQTEINQSSRSDTSADSRPKPEFSETVLNLVVAIFFYSVLAHAFRYIADWKPAHEWLVVGAGAAVLIVLYNPLKSEAVYALKLLGPYVVVLLLVFAAVSAGLKDLPGSPSKILREFVAMYFSFFPAWLFLQFVATKGKTIWDEYVFALFRLQVDDYAHLPRPPVDSYYYKIWNAARESHGEPQQQRELNPYQKKFEARFGPVGSARLSTSASSRGENLWPIAMATLLIAVGWAIVASSKIQSTGDVLAPIRFGFLGAYFYITQMLVRRYFQNDLKTEAYVQATM